MLVDDAVPDASTPPTAIRIGRAGGTVVAPPAAAPGSPPWVVAALVAANLVPLVGVLVWGWSLFDLMLLYWFESGVIGLATVLKILLTEGAEKPVPRGGAAVLGKLLVAVFFTFLYGGLWALHGVLVVAFGSDGAFGVPSSAPAFLRAFGVSDGPLPVAVLFDGALLASASGLVVSHGLSFVGNVLQRGEDLRTAPLQLLSRPFGRVFVLHVSLVVGWLLARQLGEPVAALALFVALKTGIDLAVHVRVHRTRPSARGGATA